MDTVCRPLFSMVKSWVFQGNLHDPFEEFFVKLNNDVSKEKMWQSKYSMRQDMIPSFMER